MGDRVPRCAVCTGVVKPDIVFFGEALPQRFLLHVVDFPTADLLLILGTSLQVGPRAGVQGEWGGAGSVGVREIIGGSRKCGGAGSVGVQGDYSGEQGVQGCNGAGRVWGESTSSPRS